MLVIWSQKTNSRSFSLSLLFDLSDQSDEQLQQKRLNSNISLCCIIFCCTHKYMHIHPYQKITLKSKCEITVIIVSTNTTLIFHFYYFLSLSLAHSLCWILTNTNQNSAEEFKTNMHRTQNIHIMCIDYFAKFYIAGE